MIKCKGYIKQKLFVAMLLLIFNSASSQTIQQQLSTAIKQFQSDPQMRHAITSIYVADAKTGKKIFGHNEQIGLAPASTQKIITSAAAYELLGKNFRYKTELSYKGSPLEPTLIIVASGDPTFGSWRWKETQDPIILKKFRQALQNAGISKNIGIVGHAHIRAVEAGERVRQGRGVCTTVRERSGPARAKDRDG